MQQITVVTQAHPITVNGCILFVLLSSVHGTLSFFKFVLFLQIYYSKVTLYVYYVIYIIQNLVNFHYNQDSRVVSAKVFFIFIFLRLSREFHLYLNKCMINIILYCWLAISINQTILWERGNLENNVTQKWVQSEKTKPSISFKSQAHTITVTPS